MELTELQATTTELMGAKLDQLQQRSVIAAVIGLVLCIIGAVLGIAGTGYNALGGFFQSYLYAYLFWFGVTSGSLGLLMVHHAVGGGWGFLIRRFLEAGTRLFIPMLIMFIPVAIGLLQFGLYEWARPGATADVALQQKSPYLNIPFFLARTVIYFIIYLVLARVLNRLGDTQDERNDVRIASRLNVISGGGLVLFVLMVTFVSVDWVMSLTPHWYSSIFGLLTVVSQGLATLALMTFLFGYLLRDRPILGDVPAIYFRDLGNLMLAFTMLWAYMSFSQYMITYSGNTTDEISWYVVRRSNGWGYVSLALIPLHFFLPFLVLVVGSRIKRYPQQLMWVGLLIVVMRFVDIFWWVTPTFRKEHVSVTLTDFGAPLLLGGIWLWLWAGQVRGRRMVPIHDPRVEGNFQEVVEYG
jgi:hypothetical protein